jgi:hypothetical protein
MNKNPFDPFPHVNKFGRNVGLLRELKSWGLDIQSNKFILEVRERNSKSKPGANL